MYFRQCISRCSQLLNLILWHVVCELGFLDCHFDLLHVILLYVCLLPSTLSHMCSRCSRLPLYSTWFHDLLWFELALFGIISLWIMKLWSWMLFIEVWTWCSWLQLDLIQLMYLIIACPLTVSHLGGNCSRLQLY